VSTDGNAVSVETPNSSSAISKVAEGNKQYIGNIKSKVVHLSTCDSLPLSKNRVYFKSLDEAISQGYHKHGGCIR
jgi:hypothetical protein